MIKGTVEGFLGKDPILREVRVGEETKKVCNARVAVSSGGTKTQWITVTAWERLAELLAEKAATGLFIVAEFYAVTGSCYEANEAAQVDLQFTISKFHVFDKKASNTTENLAFDEEEAVVD